MTTLAIQRRLQALGHDPGSLDGIFGRVTIRAVKAFQAARGLAADGIVGPQTLGHLFPELRDAGQGGMPAPTLPWMEEALRLKGTREAAGAADNPRILGWARRLGIAYAHDSVAWCGLFAAHCIGASLPDEPLPANPLGARGWLRFGRETTPRPGAVLVFWRGDRNGWQGHVGFHAGADSGAFAVIGGNQTDAVTVARIAKTRLLGARWPTTFPLRADAVAGHAPAGLPLSTNEA